MRPDPATVLTKEQAIAMANSAWWEHCTDRQIAEFQMEQDRLCMPFDKFHAAIETTLGRPVYTHEFGLDRDGLRRELMGDRTAPTLAQIIALLPADKTIVVTHD